METVTVALAHGKREPSTNIPKLGPDVAPVKLRDACNTQKDRVNAHAHR